MKNSRKYIIALQISIISIFALPGVASACTLASDMYGDNWHDRWQFFSVNIGITAILLVTFLILKVTQDKAMRVKKIISLLLYIATLGFTFYTYFYIYSEIAYGTLGPPIEPCGSTTIYYETEGKWLAAQPFPKNILYSFWNPLIATLNLIFAYYIHRKISKK